MKSPAESKPYARAKARYLEHLETRRRFHADRAQRIESAIDRVARSEWSDPRQIFSIIPRKRDREFVQRGLTNMSKGMDPEQAFSLAVKDTWRYSTDEAAMKVARQKLQQSEVCMAVELAVEAATGFSFDEALKWQVAHIKGEVKKKQLVVTKDGVETIEVNMPPSYPALKDLLSLIIPKQTTKVITGHFNVNDAMKMAAPTESEPRYVGKVIESHGSEEEDFTEEALRELAEEGDDE